MKEFDFCDKDSNYIIFTAAKGLWAPGWELDDILNEARLGMWEASLSWKPDGGKSWRSYAVMCARRKIMDLVSRANNQKSAFLRSYCELETSGAENIAEQSNEFNNSKQILEDLINQIELTDLERNVLDLRLREHSYADIAKRLNVTYKVVDNAQQRTIKKLKNIINPHT